MATVDAEEPCSIRGAIARSDRLFVGADAIRVERLRFRALRVEALVAFIEHDRAPTVVNTELFEERAALPGGFETFLTTVVGQDVSRHVCGLLQHLLDNGGSFFVVGVQE